MSILLQAVEVRHERRIRLIFTQPLAAGAFGVPAPSYYAVVNKDSLGVSPAIGAALVIPGSVDVLELALLDDLARGSLYEVQAVGVPGTDLSATPSGNAVQFRWGLTTPKTNVEPVVTDYAKTLYFVDLLFDGTDYVETATGDLATIAGTPNVVKALDRAIEANGLGWDPSYGAHAREYVDSPSTAAGTLKGAVSSQILRDPRVKAVTVTFDVDDEKTFLYATPTLVSGEAAEAVTLEIPHS